MLTLQSRRILFVSRLLGLCGLSFLASVPIFFEPFCHRTTIEIASMGAVESTPEYTHRREFTEPPYKTALRRLKQETKRYAEYFPAATYRYSFEGMSPIQITTRAETSNVQLQKLTPALCRRRPCSAGLGRANKPGGM